MRALSWFVFAALASSPALAQQQQNAARLPPPGPSATSGSDVGPFSGLPDNRAAPPRIFLGLDNGAPTPVTPSPANDVPVMGTRSTESVRQMTAEELDRAEQERRRAAAQLSQAPTPIQGAFTGQTDERSR